MAKGKQKEELKQVGIQIDFAPRPEKSWKPLSIWLSRNVDSEMKDKIFQLSNLLVFIIYKIA